MLSPEGLHLPQEHLECHSAPSHILNPYLEENPRYSWFTEKTYWCETSSREMLASVSPGYRLVQEMEVLISFFTVSFL